MLKSKVTRDLAMPIVDFVKYNESVFYDSRIAADQFTPLRDTAPQHISKEELKSVIALNLKADKSTGLSQMPLQLLKYMGKPGIECLAKLYNCSAID
jgi:hypothetical protein